MEVVLPGEADAARGSAGTPGRTGRSRRRTGRAAVATPARRRPGSGVVPRAHGQDGVPGHRRHLVDPHRHVGQPVLDRLELADGPAELHPDLGVLGRRLEAPAGAADVLGRQEDRHQAAHPPVVHPDQPVGGGDVGAVDHDGGHPSGGVQAGQRVDPDPDRRRPRAGTSPTSVRPPGTAPPPRWPSVRRAPDGGCPTPRAHRRAAATASSRPASRATAPTEVPSASPGTTVAGRRRLQALDEPGRPRPPSAAAGRAPPTIPSPRGRRPARTGRTPDPRGPRAGGCPAIPGRPSPSTPGAASPPRRRAATGAPRVGSGRPATGGPRAAGPRAPRTVRSASVYSSVPGPSEPAGSRRRWPGWGSRRRPPGPVRGRRPAGRGPPTPRRRRARRCAGAQKTQLPEPTHRSRVDRHAPSAAPTGSCRSPDPDPVRARSPRPWGCRLARRVRPDPRARRAESGRTSRRHDDP